MSTVHRELPVPDAVRGLGAMTDPDYLDVFTLTTGDAADWTPEQWARAMFDDVAGWQGQVLFRVLLGLRLARRRSPEHVAGWRIDERGADSVRLAAKSWFLTARLVVRVTDGRVSLATFMHYDRALAARIWGPTSARHRAAAPGLLREAHDVLVRSRRGDQSSR
ncbi:hypothetical protein [Pseudonocardia humida]|nr:hypothetical protein [Pseudonocardia humida]